MNPKELHRCTWAERGGEIDVSYHDNEWGVELHDEHKLFEFLILEGAQAGLSWSTILKKREAYRKAYEGFNPQEVAAFDEAKRAELMQNPGIIRNRLKINSSIQNAKAFLQVQREFGSFDRYIWQFVDYVPVQNNWSSMDQVPASTDLSQKMSKDLKSRGFNFVGPTICYAFMQAIGMVNDHLTSCYRHNKIKTISPPK